MMLLSSEVDFAVMYEVPGDRSPAIPAAFDTVVLGTDNLIPVCIPSMNGAIHGPAIPMISYPPDVFLGQVFDRTIAARLAPGVSTASKAETALTLAMLQFVLSGIGIAWLPASLVVDHLALGSLVRIDELPAQALDIKMIHLSEGQTARLEAIWHQLVNRLVLPPALERLPDGFSGLVQPIE